jgi:hypothetical protein
MTDTLTPPRTALQTPRTALVLCLTLLSALATAAPVSAAGVQETRCGWFDNPTPANAWITDRDGQWIIGAQGGRQADGDWPDFPDNRWVHTNGGSYGHGCACVQGIFDRKRKDVLRIISARTRPLSVCRADKALKEPE